MYPVVFVFIVEQWRGKVSSRDIITDLFIYCIGGKGGGAGTLVAYHDNLGYPIYENMRFLTISISFQDGEDNTIDIGNGQHIPRDADNAKNVVRRGAQSTDPPESQFKHLRPSDNRYTLLEHDEF